MGIIFFLASDCKKEEQETITKSDLKSDLKSDSKSGANHDSLIVSGANHDSFLVIDADSNVYHTVTIGRQIWLVENLKTTKYLSGDSIPSHLFEGEWINNTGAVRINSDIYGNLYNAYAVADPRKICPAGWHVPSASEWDELLNYLGGENLAGGPMKESGTDHWFDPNVGATNESGFTALPAGFVNSQGSTISIGSNAAWWSCAKSIAQAGWAWAYQCSFAATDAGGCGWEMNDGLSVRCINDNLSPFANPFVSSGSIIDITATTAKSGGSIVYEGVAAITSRGVCWSTKANPTISDSKTVDGNGIGEYVSNIVGLTAGTIYHVRAYATNSAGTAYGSDMSFSTVGQSTSYLTQPATNVSGKSATLNGIVNANDLPTTVIFEYGTTISYDLGSGHHVSDINGATQCASQSPVSGNTITNVSTDIDCLMAGTTYHFRVKTVNSIGTVYGDDITFVTLVAPGPVPAFFTQPATNVSETTATLNGTVNTDNLSMTVTFEYGTTTSYGSTVTSAQSPVTWNTSTDVSATLTGLTGGITYNYRVKAVNSMGTSYGDNKIFNSANLPTVTTTPASNITTTTAISGGNIIDDGGALITTRGVYWGFSDPNGVHLGIGRIPHTNDGTGSGSYTSFLTGLKPAKTYYVQSYAVNSKGLKLGNVISFTTLPPCDQVPIVTTMAATNISSTGATLNGTVNANGSPTTITFQYSVNSFGRGPGWKTITATESPITGNGITNVSANISDLRSGTTHLFYVIATNSCGTVDGDKMSFTIP